MKKYLLLLVLAACGSENTCKKFDIVVGPVSKAVADFGGCDQEKVKNIIYSGLDKAGACEKGTQYAGINASNAVCMVLPFLVKGVDMAALKAADCKNIGDKAEDFFKKVLNCN